MGVLSTSNCRPTLIYNVSGNWGMDDNLDFDAEFRVRLPSDLAKRIADTAAEERRSRNLQYVYMLESWFELKGTLEERVKKLEALITKKDAKPN